jgi:hypothetical protein
VQKQESDRLLEEGERQHARAAARAADEASTSVNKL